MWMKCCWFIRSAYDYWTPLSQRGTSEKGEGPGVRALGRPFLSISMVFVIALMFGALGSVWATRRFHLRRENFRQQSIPSVAGLFLVLAGIVFYGALWLRPAAPPLLPVHYFLFSNFYFLFLLVTFCFGMLGFIDDLFGDRSVGGFRGHLNALRHGRITTGLIKLLGGGIASLAAGYLLYPVRTGNATIHYSLFTIHFLLAALAIALCANTLNLLDVRPGRCLFGFFLGAAVVVAVLAVRHQLGAGCPLYFAAAVALILYPLDATGRAMLGDTGSNTFGALLGLALALFFPTALLAMAVAAMAAFQIWCERNSFSQAIERSPVLRSLDRKIGVR
jgi:UDP-GlcNAc:undecaprenyl-phosphate/decaprenyl-phosphate GlcNAc-1-phosphate transferase